MTLLERLTADGPKRILALDGGGIRGALTLGYLERIEQILRDRHGRPDLLLRDYFDLIGGTSTGAIIAAGLAIGMSAKEIKDMYLELGGEIFKSSVPNRPGWWQKLALLDPAPRFSVTIAGKTLGWGFNTRGIALFDPEPLEEKLQEVLGDRILCDASIPTGLCIVTKRADTRSTWPLTNHPNAKYVKDNCGMLLRQVVRASTAAPVYFLPESMDVGRGQRGAFIDGGVSMANNPALLLFLVATLKGFPFHWETGEDKLLLVSIGTGYWHQRDDVDKVLDHRVWNWAVEIPSLLMEDATWQNQMLLQYLSRSPTSSIIDREIGDLGNDLLTPEPALTYLRYNVELGLNTLQDLGLTSLASRARELRKMSVPENRFDLATIGEKAADSDVREEHFPERFNVA